MIGKVFRKGFGMIAGKGPGGKSLANKNVLGGIGMISMGMLGTTHVFKSINKNRESLRSGRQNKMPHSPFRQF